MVRNLAMLGAGAILFLLAPMAAEAGQWSERRREGVIVQSARDRSNSSLRAYRHRPHGHYYYFSPYFPPTAVMSPYGPIYYSPYRVVEVTKSYFCALHNVGFVTRAGMLDHLAGTHKYPLQSTVHFCPDGAEVCIYPLPQ